MILSHKKIKAIPERSKVSTEPKIKPIPEPIPKRKKHHTMSRDEKKIKVREISEKAMEKAKLKNIVDQKIEIPNVDKYAIVASSPCIGCLLDCIPQNCDALTNYALGGL